MSLQNLPKMDDKKQESIRTKRTTFNRFQLEKLQEMYEVTIYPYDNEISDLSKELHLTFAVIKVSINSLIDYLYYYIMFCDLLKYTSLNLFHQKMKKI